MYLPLFVLSVFLLAFCLWLKFSQPISLAAGSLQSAPKPSKHYSKRPPKHHKKEEYINTQRQLRRKQIRENLERWQHRARREMLP